MSTTTVSRWRRETDRAEGLAILAWLNDLDRSDPAERLAAVRSLGVMCTGNDDPIVIEALTCRLADASPAVRAAAASALAAIGRLTSAAKSSLVGLTRDPHAEVRIAAIAALVTAPGPDLSPVLSESLGDADADVRAAALDALRQLGPQARSEVTRASALIDDPVADIRAAALSFFADVAADEVDFRRVVPRLRDGDAAVRQAAVGLLAAGRSTDPQVLQELCEMLADPTAEVRWAAASALSRRGPAASPATPALLAATRDVSPHVCQAARTALANLNESARPWVPYLMQIRQLLTAAERSLVDRADALIAGSIDSPDAGGPAMSTIAGYFREILDHPSEIVVWNGGIGLSTVGPAASVAGPKLVRLLARDETHLRVCGVCGFLGMGTAALPWLDVLVSRVADRDPLVRQLAIMAIGGIGVRAAAAVSSLRAAMKDPREDVRTAVAMALAAIESPPDVWTNPAP